MQPWSDFPYWHGYLATIKGEKIMEPWVLAIIITAAVLSVTAVITTVLVLRLRHKQKKATGAQSKAEPVTVVEGVRYTPSNTLFKSNGNIKATFLVGDFVLERGKEVTVSKTGLLPGKYTVLSTDESMSSFNIRVGGFVREYKHASSIILAEGDKISAVSISVILR